MSIENSEIEVAFFTDAKEQLDALEGELLNLETNDCDEETLNKIFRAMHTIKGSAGFAGFREIESFTHNVENLMHIIREGSLEINEDILQILLDSRDLINNMVEFRTKGEILDSEKNVEMLESEISKFTDRIIKKVANKNEKNEGNVSVKNYFRIHLEFNENLYETGTDPLLIIEDLSQNFEILESNIIVKNIPLISSLDPYKNYLNWQIIAAGKGSIQDLESIFMFVSLDNKVTIDSIAEEEIKFSGERLGEIFVSKGFLKESEVEEVMKEHIPLGEDLIKKGAVTKKMVDNAVEEQKKFRSVVQMNTIRINTDKLDEIIDAVGEVVVAKSRIRASMEKKGWLEIDEESMLEELDRYVDILQKSVMKTRMIPIKDTFIQFRRMVRDLSHQQQKQVDFNIIGEDTELDKNVIEKLKDPLKHMIRNSIDHGIESPFERMEIGKPASGTLTLKAFHEGGEVIIEIVDDGRGLDKEKIKKKANSLGFTDENMEITEEEIYKMIFKPGFSTAEKITDISGRGVGMDVVLSNLNSIRGNINVKSKKNAGTTFRINIPLTLAIIEGILIKVRNNYFIIPIHSVTEFLTIENDKFIGINKKNTAIPFRNKFISVINLAELFELGETKPQILTVIQSSNQYLGILVDEVIGKYQVVIKSLEENYRKVEYISGATLLGNGSIAMILDINALINRRKN